MGNSCKKVSQELRALYTVHTNTHAHTASLRSRQNKESGNLGWLSLKISLFSLRLVRVLLQKGPLLQQRVLM